MRPLVVFLPALLLDRRNWNLVLPHLPPESDVDFVETPTFDAALDPESALRAYETNLAGRIAREEPERRMVLAGNSLGAYVLARVLARTTRPNVAGLVVAGFARLPSDQVAARVDAAARIERGELGVAALVHMLREGAIAQHDRREETERLMSAMLESLTPASLAWNLRLTAPLADPSWEVPPHRTPMTILHGRRDATISFAQGEELALRGRASKLVALDTSSHLLPLSHSAEVAMELNALLRHV